MTAATVSMPRVATPVIIQEMEYASDLLMRADAAITREFDVLRAGGVVIDFTASQGLSVQMIRMAAMLHMLALQAVEIRRAANVAQGVPA